MNQAKAVKGEPNVLFYTTVTHGPGERLQRVIEGLVPTGKTTVSQKDILCDRVFRPMWIAISRMLLLYWARCLEIHRGLRN